MDFEETRVSGGFVLTCEATEHFTKENAKELLHEAATAIAKGLLENGYFRQHTRQAVNEDLVRTTLSLRVFKPRRTLP